MISRFAIISAFKRKQTDRDMEKPSQDELLANSVKYNSKSSANGVDKKESYIKDFLKKLSEVSSAHDPKQVFCDACRMFCLSLRGVVTLDPKEKDAIETEYASYVKKYGDKAVQKVAEMFAIVVEALEYRREDFLGRVYERLNATVKSFGQFLTPDSVARFMARITFGDKPKSDEIVKLNDSACGAGALLIEGAEAFMDAGGKQANLLIYAEDLDPTSCNIVYVQLTLLGYAAIVRHMNTLSMKVIDGPWYTIGFFAHAFPMRRSKWDDRFRSVKAEEEPKGTEEPHNQVKEDVQESHSEPIDMRKLVQGELF